MALFVDATSDKEGAVGGSHQANAPPLETLIHKLPPLICLCWQSRLPFNPGSLQDTEAQSPGTSPGILASLKICWVDTARRAERIVRSAWQWEIFTRVFPSALLRFSECPCRILYRQEYSCDDEYTREELKAKPRSKLRTFAETQQVDKVEEPWLDLPIFTVVR